MRGWRIGRWAWTVGAVLLAVPALAQDAPVFPCGISEPCPVQVSIAAGGVVSLGGGTDSALRPLVSGLVDLPVSDAPMGPRVVVAFDLGALPGESLDLLQPETYRSIAFRGGLTQRLSRRLKFSLYASLGFATRLPGDTEPRNRTARWASFGVRFAGERGLLELGAGPDERLGGGYLPTGHLRAALDLGERMGVRAWLIGEALLALRLGYAPAERIDLVLVGVGLGR